MSITIRIRLESSELDESKKAGNAHRPFSYLIDEPPSHVVRRCPTIRAEKVPNRLVRFRCLRYRPPYRDNQLASRCICAEKEIITGRDGSSLSCPYTGLICRPEYMSPPRWRRTFPGQPFLRPATDVIMDKIVSAGAGGDVQNYLSCGFNIICRAQHSAHRRTSEGHFRLAASPAPQAQAGSPARQLSAKTLR
jgi:hypothetical protein